MRNLTIVCTQVILLLAFHGNADAGGRRENSRGVASFTLARDGADGVQAEAYSYNRTPARESGAVAAPGDTSGEPSSDGLVAVFPEASRFAPEPCDLIADAENRNGYDISSDFAAALSCGSAPDDNNRNRRRRRGPDLSGLIAAAIDRATSLAPGPELGIAPSRIGLTGLETFLWASDPLAPISATASAGGVTVTAEAAVTHYRFDFGDGYETVSYGPGRPWTTAHAGSVGHTYEIKGYYDITVDAIWTGRWRINSGPWQPLGSFSTSDTRRYPVQEIVTRLVETH